jgi:GTPase Era involved in 16S rRNA processing
MISSSSHGIKKQAKKDKPRAADESESDEEEIKNDDCITILVVGAPEAGKSNFGNFMLDGKNSQRFKSSSECVSGVTRTIRMEINHALNVPTNKKVRLIDMPGFGDPELGLVKYAKEIKKLLKKQNIDICLIVTKATDTRI